MSFLLLTPDGKEKLNEQQCGVFIDTRAFLNQRSNYHETNPRLEFQITLAERRFLQHPKKHQFLNNEYLSREVVRYNTFSIFFRLMSDAFVNRLFSIDADAVIEGIVVGIAAVIEESLNGKNIPLKSCFIYSIVRTIVEKQEYNQRLEYFRKLWKEQFSELVDKEDFAEFVNLLENVFKQPYKKNFIGHTVH